MNPNVVGQAVGLFAVTNVDDILVLALFFARGAGRPGATRAVVTGQYLGFAAILAVAVAAAFGVKFLPAGFVPYLGLLPIALGIRAAVQAWRHRGDDGEPTRSGGPRTLEVAAVALANGGDNIGVYVPVFATAGPGGTSVYVVVFLVLVAAWLAAGRHLAARPAVARALARWGHVALPVVLIALGLLILTDGAW
ncbi:cadmium resistance transporter [Amycolatopsis carbonis]|uniref:Cadmium resistance transporter n=1 Tax=Amycolatopsis carbonis TaxID=715471 RepID=A0A9Y2IIK8_9PSEU|nr:cadmium resistance transporter [Amycolatopsis sp. 2-15]WIX79936.1 cadmium resistance transporter [Amycolatopsis sp. 2-15]